MFSGEYLHMFGCTYVFIVVCLVVSCCILSYHTSLVRMSLYINDEWLFREEQIRDRPSVRAGMSDDEEMAVRRKGVKLITDVGKRLNLKINPTCATACVFFHRFYMCHTFKDFDYGKTALACLFLAGKVEETPKKCRDICATARSSIPKNSPAFQIFVDDVMAMERVLLQTIRFNMQVDHPYKYLVEYGSKFPDVPKEKITELVRCACTLVNDSYSTLLYLTWEPQIIAVSLFYLAIKLTIEILQVDLNETKWWEDQVAELERKKIDEICHSKDEKIALQVLDYYAVMKKDK